jgi:2-aminoadipate transaminase
VESKEGTLQRDTLARRASRLPGVIPAPVSHENIAFDSGHASPSVLPDLTAEAARALSGYRAETLQYAPRPGLAELRAWIVDYMNADGAKVTRDNILVTNGAKHAIELICRLLLDEGDTIVVTAPTYFTSIPIFRSYGVSFIEVPQDADGLIVSELASILERLETEGQAIPKFVYNVPDFHNPTGVTMSLERRRALIDLALRYRFYVIEDSPYRKVRFEGASVPSLKAIDRDDRVFYVGTFSKLMAPGLRVGWVAAAPDLIARMIQLKSDGGSCPLTQRVIVDFCTSGRLTAHIEEVQRAYRERRDHMVTALRRELPEASFEVPNGGYYIWITLPAGTDADAVARAASDGGVTVIAGSKFFARSDVGPRLNHLRLAYSHATLDEIDEGVRRLASAFRSIASPGVLVAR